MENTGKVRVIEIKKNIFADNNKDTTLIRTLNLIKDKIRVAVMEACPCLWSLLPYGQSGHLSENQV